MAMIGTYNGSVIETGQTFRQGQRFLLIPINGDPKANPEKARLIRELAGSVPDSGYAYEAVRQERREAL